MSDDNLEGAMMNSAASAEELTSEQALRPSSLDEFVGQKRVKDQISLLLRAAREIGRAHV